MAKNKHKNSAEAQETQQVESQHAEETQANAATADTTNEALKAANASLQAKVEELEEKVAELEDAKLRQMAEFDNYRRRTNKEKLDLMETAGEKIFTEMLSLIDDFERASEAMHKTEDVASLREGVDLIYQKFMRFLGKHDVHAIETKDADFNTDEHEAITTFAAGEDKKGKVVDCTQKGYKLGDKVIRFAKVVVGE